MASRYALRWFKNPVFLISVWILLALVFAESRSYWCDEFVRYNQTLLSLKNAVWSVLHEPSPFSPMEVVVDWVLRRALDKVLPDEIWSRLPGIFFGAATLWVGTRLVRNIPSLRFLPYLLFFSTALFSLSIEMRPYGSLIYCGAIATFLWLGGPVTNVEKIMVWVGLIFGHIYGICFISFAALLRKHFGKAAFGFAYVSVILSAYKIAGNEHGIDWSSLPTIVRESLGLLSNPSKSALVTVPLAGIGIFYVFKKGLVTLRAFIEGGLLAGAMIIGPIFATLHSGYFFVPRQIAGGLFLFLALVAYGLNEVASEAYRRFPQMGKIFAVGIVGLTLGFAGLRPWVNHFLLQKPPFINQPMHRFSRIAGELLGGKENNFLMVDAANGRLMVHYFSQNLGRAADSFELINASGTVLERSCWKREPEAGGPFCYSAVKDTDISAGAEDVFRKGTKLYEMMTNQQPRFDVVLYSFDKFVPLPDGIRGMRTW